MKNESLLYFNNPNELRVFVKELNIYNGWKINSGLLNDRGKTIQNKAYTNSLRDLFREKKFFRKEVSVAEIISWLDNLTLIQRLFDKLEKKLSKEVFDNIEISVEYMIKMSKRMRIDYLIIYQNNILLLEMRTVSNFNKLRATWDKKFQELLVYKELMGNYLHNKTFRLYALIPLFEYNGSTPVERHIINNQKQLDYLVEYISLYIIC